MLYQLYLVKAKSVASSLLVLFQNLHDTGIVPSDWKRANKTPIYKKDDQKNKKTIAQLA